MSEKGGINMNNARVFTGEDVAEWMRRIVVFNGHKRNPLGVGGYCRYVDDNGDHCLVGEWLYDVVGADDEFLGNDARANVNAETVLKQAAETFRFGYTLGAEILLSEAQKSADSPDFGNYEAYIDTARPTARMPWADAVRRTLLHHEKSAVHVTNNMFANGHKSVERRVLP